MLLDIFSLFDPSSFSSKSPILFALTLPTLLLILTMFMPQHSTNHTRLLSSHSTPLSIILSQLSRTFSFHLKGLSSVISPLFLLIILTNLLGMTPYSFSLSSHLLMTLSIGLPLWASMILSSLILSPQKSIAHLLPDGAPEWLNPFLVLIESTSVLVRPLTLSFRLAANMTAGHVVLSLINSYLAPMLTLTQAFSLITLLISSGYILFEFAICLIQAYIFCLLLSLYSDDHA